jgi:hypothetical protein
MPRSQSPEDIVKSIEKSLKPKKSDLKRAELAETPDPSPEQIPENSALTIQAPAEKKQTEKEFKELCRKMKPQHKAFAEQFIKSLNLVKSYSLIYPESSEKAAFVSGSKLLKTPNIQKYLDYIHNKRQEKYEISENSMLNKLNEIYVRSMQQVEVLDKHGKPTGKYNFNGMAAAKATELIAKITGIMDNRKNLNQDNLVIIKTFVIPAFKNTIAAPSFEEEDVKRLIESYLKERQGK